MPFWRVVLLELDVLPWLRRRFRLSCVRLLLACSCGISMRELPKFASKLFGLPKLPKLPKLFGGRVHLIFPNWVVKSWVSSVVDRCGDRCGDKFCK